MNVMIVSRTRMKNHICVGAVSRCGRTVRLLNEQGYNQPKDTSLQIGQFYDITYTERSNKLAPHTEDILVHSFAHRGQARSARAILFSHVKNNRVRIFKDPLDQLFDGCLQLTDTSPASCYMSQANGTSSFSTVFWQPDRDLHHQKNFTHDYYIYDNRIKIKFIGFQFPLASLTSQHIVRLSLARWWSADEFEEKRCYLQLSGWY